MQLSTRVHGEHFSFGSLKEVLGRANELRSGDRQADLSARSMREMAAAKRVLADITLAELREHPSVPYEKDEVTRVVEDGLDDPAFQKVKGWSVSELREWILDDKTTGEEIRAISPGLTPEMAAVVVKLMSNMDLVLGAQKIRVVVRCNATLGLAGRISANSRTRCSTAPHQGAGLDTDAELGTEQNTSVFRPLCPRRSDRQASWECDVRAVPSGSDSS